MSFKKMLAAVLVALSVLFMVQPAAAQPDDSITFKLKSIDGRSLGEASVPASQALGASLATYFQGIADAIREMLAAGGNQTRSVWLSSQVLVELVGTNLVPTAPGGGVVSSP